MAGRDTPLGLFSEEAPSKVAEVSPRAADASGSALAPDVSALVAEPRPSTRRSRLIQVGVLLVVAAVVGLSAVWAIQSRGALVSAVRDRLTSDPLLATRGQVPQPGPPPSVSPIELPARKEAAGRPPGRRRRAKKATEERLAAIENGPAEVKVDQLVTPIETKLDRPAVATSEPVAADAAPLGAERVVEPGEASRVADATPARIYSERDPDVTPPEPRRPQKLTALHVAGRPDDVVTIELVINARGTLDSARATTAPRSVGESLLLATGLHAVKSWEFWPALKDGFPVSYRKLMSLGAY